MGAVLWSSRCLSNLTPLVCRIHPRANGLRERSDGVVPRDLEGSPAIGHVVGWPVYENLLDICCRQDGLTAVDFGVRNSRAYLHCAVQASGVRHPDHAVQPADTLS